MSKEKIKFSIIMSTYDRKNCIKNAIDSLLVQTYQNFELIIVDDGSTDGTDKYIEEIYKREMDTGKINYLKLDKNYGLSYARNKGLEISMNEWIGYFDTDNKMYPEFLETYAKYISENPEYKIFYAKIKHRNSGLSFGHDFNYFELLRNNFIDSNVIVHNVELFKEIGGYRTEINRLIDWDLMIRYTKKYKPYFIDKVLIDYYDGDNFKRITNNNLAGKNYKNIILNYYKDIPDEEFIQEYDKGFQKIDELSGEIEIKERMIENKTQEIENLDEIIKQNKEEIKNLNNDIKIKDKEVEDVKQIIAQKDQEINALRNSTSWKITKPIRIIKNKLLRLKELIKYSFVVLKNEGLLNFLKRTFKYILKKIINGTKNNSTKIPEIVDFSLKNNYCDYDISKFKVSVVILSLNRIEDTKRCIYNLYKNIPINFELIILDNGSDENVQEELKNISKKYKNLKLIIENCNLGCAGGRKKAFALASGDYVLSIDNDIIVTPFFLENLLKRINKYKNVAGVCAKTVFPDGRIQFNGGFYFIKDIIINYGLIDNNKFYNNNSTFNEFFCDWIPGGATLWKKNILNKFEIDKNMMGSYEDNEYCFSLEKNNYKFLNSPKSIVIHNHINFNVEAKKDKKYMMNRYNNNRIIFGIKHFYKKHNLIIMDTNFYETLGVNYNNKKSILNLIARK